MDEELGLCAELFGGQVGGGRGGAMGQHERGQLHVRGDRRRRVGGVERDRASGGSILVCVWNRHFMGDEKRILAHREPGEKGLEECDRLGDARSGGGDGGGRPRWRLCQ